MTIDLTPVLPLLETIVLATLSAGAPVVGLIVARLAGITITAHRAQIISMIANTAAKGMYSYIVQNKGNVFDKATMEAALGRGVNHVLTSAPDQIKAMGYTPDHIAEMVAAHFGGLLAADPAVTVSGKPPTIEVTGPAVEISPPVVNQHPPDGRPVQQP